MIRWSVTGSVGPLPLTHRAWSGMGLCNQCLFRLDRHVLRRGRGPGNQRLCFHLVSQSVLSDPIVSGRLRARAFPPGIDVHPQTNMDISARKCLVVVVVFTCGRQECTKPRLVVWKNEMQTNVQLTKMFVAFVVHLSGFLQTLRWTEPAYTLPETTADEEKEGAKG